MSTAAKSPYIFKMDADEEVTGGLVLQKLLDEYRRVSKEQDAPQGAYQNLVLFCLDSELAYIIDEYAFDEDQSLEAELYFTHYVETSCGRLLEITYERIKGKQRIERRFKAEIEDLIIARMMALLFDLRDNLEEYILDQLTVH